MRDIEECRTLLEGSTIESVELVQMKERILLNSLRLRNGIVIHLAPSTLGVVIGKLESSDVKQGASRNSIKNRAQTGLASRKPSRSKRKTSKWTVKARG